MSKNKVYISLSNRIAILHRPYDYEKLLKHWSFSIPSYRFVTQARPELRKCKICSKYPSQHKKHKKNDHEYVPIWDGKIKFLKRDRLSTGLYYATKEQIEKESKIRFVEDRIGIRTVPMFSSDKWLKSEGKYDFQNKCVDSMQAAISSGGGLILNATGSGKTRIAAMAGSRFNCKILFVVDQLNLLEQAREDIRKHLGEKVGKVGESKFKPRRITVATRQTLMDHLKDEKFKQWFNSVPIIIIDEIHEMLNRSNAEIVGAIRPIAVFGLTATLKLSKKEIRLKAYSLAGPTLFTYPVQQGMHENVLSKGIAISLLYNNDIRETNAYSNSEEAYKDRIVKNGERNYVISSLVKKASRLGKYTIVLVERLKHLSRLSHALGDVRHRIVAGTFRGEKISQTSRRKHQKRFEKGSIRVILANRVMKKGINIKRVDVIIDAAARKSKEDAVQKFGRGVRLHNNKRGLIYVDVCDVDKYDKTRSRYDKNNWFAKAGKSRRRGLVKAGITVKKFLWEDECEKELFKQAEKWLDKEIKRHEASNNSRR